MLYPDDVERLAALSEQASRWVLGWYATVGAGFQSQPPVSV